MQTRTLISASDLTAFQKDLQKHRNANKTVLTICAGTGCLACGCEKVTETFRQELKKNKLEDAVEIKTTGCHGFCERGPLVVIQPQGLFYQKVTSTTAHDIIEQTIKNGQIVKKLLYHDPITKEIIQHEKDIPFYKKQKRLIFGKNGFMDPTAINDYIILGGYQGMAKAITTIEPDAIIEEVTKSGLRGRGGGGFSTGKKWRSCKKAEGTPKYIICNADEGDPGAFMDRSLLEGNPHQVIEGMIIGAFAVGSNEGFVYVRHEYPLAVKNLSIAI